MATTRALLRAPWSASKVQMALRCPREFHYRYVDKIAEREVMPEALIGKAIHKALEHALQGTPAEIATADARKELQDERQEKKFDRIANGIQPFLDRIAAFREKHRVGRQLVEFTLAVREDFTETAFYSPDALYRGVFDAGYVYEDGNIAIIDHKTGFRVASHRITEQLQGYAVLSAAHFRKSRRIWLGVHWVADADVEWSPALSVAEIRERLLPDLLDNIEAAALAVADGPRPEPSLWCDVCSYRSICPAAYSSRFEPVDDEELDPYIYD